MLEKGQVYKFTGIWGHIRPDTWGQTRMDVLFKRNEHKLVLGDHVQYDLAEKNERKYAENLKKIG
jgi:hypothetical protein